MPCAELLKSWLGRRRSPPREDSSGREPARRSHRVSPGARTRRLFGRFTRPEGIGERASLPRNRCGLRSVFHQGPCRRQQLEAQFVAEFLKVFASTDWSSPTTVLEWPLPS